MNELQAHKYKEKNEWMTKMNKWVSWNEWTWMSDFGILTYEHFAAGSDGHYAVVVSETLRDSFRAFIQPQL